MHNTSAHLIPEPFQNFLGYPDAVVDRLEQRVAGLHDVVKVIQNLTDLHKIVELHEHLCRNDSDCLVGEAGQWWDS